ncbi:MAG: hypothetical protein ACYSXD_10785, partial [Planctomycetota bacterium]
MEKYANKDLYPFCLREDEWIQHMATGIMTISWKQIVEEYRETKKVQGVAEATLYEIALTLRHFERLIGRCNSRQISQNSIDKFVLERGQ